MKKRLIFSFFFFFLFIFNSNLYSYNLSCKEQEDSSNIEKCYSLKQNYRQIEEFICINWSIEEIAYQYFLDKHFKKIDIEIEEFLIFLETEKDLFFWKNKQANFQDAVDLIYSKFYSLKDESSFLQLYTKSCSLKDWSIMKDTISCFFSKGDKSISYTNFSSTCYELAKVKLSIYYDISINILKKNKYKILKDWHKSFTKVQRTRYDNLINLLNLNISYIERIWKKWPSKTKNIYK